MGEVRPQGTGKSATNNMLSALENPQVVDEYLHTEQGANQVIEVHNTGSTCINVSRFGVIPKAGQPKKWRLILDLSHPINSSVNDGIDKSLCSMQYTSVDQAVTKLLEMGRGALMAKIDIQHAYRNVPVHPEDRWLLGMKWKGKVLIDCVLPFGLRSAPIIFSALADALERIILKKGVTNSMHYLDDFLIMGKQGSSECQSNLSNIMIAVCKDLGVPLKLEKIEGPSAVLTFLGFTLDTIKMEIRLPLAKLRDIQMLMEAWQHKRKCTKRELLSLIGKLSHACKVITPGRIFLRRMIETACSVSRLNHWIALTREFRSDLQWWRLFIKIWNGKSMLYVHKKDQVPDVIFSSDASGSWGCGACWLKHWIQHQWDDHWRKESIAAKELLPIVLACAIWGPYWEHKHVLVECDNMAVVSVINSLSCKDQMLAHLLRCLHFYTAH